MNKLPEKLSACIRIAHDDLIKCENDPRYRVHMSVWHSHTITFDEHSSNSDGSMTTPLPAGVCAVCLGGSVLSQTCAIPWETENDVVFDLLDEHTSRRIQALDRIRRGDVVTAVNHVEGDSFTDAGVERAVKLRKIEDCHSILYRSYEKSPEGFKEWLRGIATELERAGH